MFIDLFKTIPYWLPIAFAYLFVGGIAALTRRVLWLPVVFMVPLVFLGLQYSLFIGISHELQLMALLALMAGIGFGGTVIRPTILTVIPGMRFEVAGEGATLALVTMIFFIKVATSVCSVAWPEWQVAAQSVSVVSGSFVPGAFFGRALFLLARLRR